MSVSIQPPAYEFRIGTFDASDYLVSFQIKAPMAELKTPLIWQGNFKVSYNRRAQSAGLTDNDLDPATNPSIWRPAQKAVTIKVDGLPLPKLRIDRYAYNAQTGSGEGTLTQILLAMDGDRPATEPEIRVQENNEIDFAVRKLLELGFSTSSVISPVILDGLTGYIDSPIATRTPIGDAQNLCGLNLQALTVNSLEQVITVSLDPANHPILFQRALKQLPAGGWEPDLQSIHFAADLAIVSGSRQVPDTSKPCSGPPDPNLDHLGRKLKVPTTEVRPFATVFNTGGGAGGIVDTQLITAEEKVIYYRYNFDFVGINLPLDISLPQTVIDDIDTATSLNTANIDSHTPIATLTIKRWPAGRIFPALGQNTNLRVAEVTVETPFRKAVYKCKGALIPSLGSNFNLTAETREDIPQPATNCPGHFQSSEIDPGTGKALIYDRPPQAQAPQPRPQRPLKTQSIRAYCNIAPNGWTPIRKRPYVTELGFIPSQGHADLLAAYIAFQQVRRRDAVQISMAPPREWLAAGCPLLARCLVHDGEFQIDGPILDFDSNRFTLSFSGGKIRHLTTPIAPPAQPAPYIPGGSSLGLAPTLPAVLGVPIQPFQLSIGAVIVAQLPPGLSVSPSGLISGVPTALGPQTFTVTNGAQSQVISVQVGSVPTGGALASQLIDNAVICRSAVMQLGGNAVLNQISSRSSVVQLNTINQIVESTGKSKIVQIVLAPATVGQSVGVSAVQQTGFIRNFSSALAVLNGSAGLTAMSIAGSFAYTDFQFRFKGQSTSSNANILVTPQSELTINSGGAQPKVFIDWLQSPNYRDPGAIWQGSLAPGTHTIRWEGSAAAPYVGPPDLIWELTIFEEGAIQIVTGPTVGNGLSELEFNTGYPAYSIAHISIPLTSNSSVVLLPTGGTYVAFVGSYS